MRNEILQLKDLGRMPNESINDTESIDELVNTYDALLEQIQLPISFDEAMVLVQIFPENAFYDLQWSLLKLVESVCVDDENKYIQLINSCPSQEWRDTLNARYANYKRHKGKSKFITSRDNGLTPFPAKPLLTIRITLYDKIHFRCDVLSDIHI